MVKGVSRLGRVFLITATLLMYANLLVSFQRWAWICLALAFALTILYYRRRKSRYALLGVVAAALLLFGTTAFTQLGGYFQEATDPTSGSNITARLRDWQEGLSILFSNPAGLGFGTAGTLADLSDTSSHNLFIDIGVEGGVLALMGTVVWAVYHLRLTVGLILRAETDSEWSFALLLGAFTFVVYGIFFNSLLYFSGLMVWLALWWLYPVMASAIFTAPVNHAAPNSSVQLRNRTRTATPPDPYPAVFGS
jgi:O-antigen ligase